MLDLGLIEGGFDLSLASENGGFQIFPWKSRVVYARGLLHPATTPFTLSPKAERAPAYYMNVGKSD